MYKNIFKKISGPSSKSSSGVSSPTFPSGSISPCDFPFGTQSSMLNDLTGKILLWQIEPRCNSNMSGCDY